jgi:hypothetical protein
MMRWVWIAVTAVGAWTVFQIFLGSQKKTIPGPRLLAWLPASIVFYVALAMVGLGGYMIFYGNRR